MRCCCCCCCCCCASKSSGCGQRCHRRSAGTYHQSACSVHATTTPVLIAAKGEHALASDTDTDAGNGRVCDSPGAPVDKAAPVLP